MRCTEVLHIVQMGLEVNVEYVSCLMLSLSILAITYRDLIIQDNVVWALGNQLRCSEILPTQLGLNC